MRALFVLTSVCVCRCRSDAKIPCSQNTYNDQRHAHLITNCTRCPLRTETRGLSGRSSVDDCSCLNGFYYAPSNFTDGRPECVERCCTCPVGTTCDGIAIKLSDLPVGRGYFRLTADSVDVRRCPDAAVNCSGRSECSSSTSGCSGGNSTQLCREGLNGPFCRSCIEPFHFYERATDEGFAHCEPCANLSSSRSASILFAFVATICAALVAVLAIRRAPLRYKALAALAWENTKRYSIPTKLKVVIGFYQIATRIEEHSLRNTRSLPLTTHYSLLTTHYSLLTTHCSLLTAHCSLLTAHCSLLTALCSTSASTASPCRPKCVRYCSRYSSPFQSGLMAYLSRALGPTATSPVSSSG